MARVLIIEDEATLRASVARGLGRLPQVEVAAAGTMAEAMAELDQAPPDLILSDIDLPDRSGIEVLGELGRRGLRRPVVFVSAYLRAYAAQIPPHADVEVLEKPVSLETLREVVTRRLRAPEGEESAPFCAADYLQLACIGRRSVRIDVQAGSLRGRLVVHGGLAWSAEDTLGKGELAFRRLAFRRDGHVDCQSLATEPGQRNLHKGWEGLILEAAQAIDESRRGVPAPPEAAGSWDIVTAEPPPTKSSAKAPVPEPPPEPAEPAEPLEPELSPEEKQFAEVWDRGVQALLGRRHADALEAFMEALVLRPDDRKVRANLARLEALGYTPRPAEPSTEIKEP